MSRYTDNPAEDGNAAGRADARADAFAVQMVAEGFRMDVGGDFMLGPESLTQHNGMPYMVRTCYELVEGRWEGFVSMRAGC